MPHISSNTDIDESRAITVQDGYHARFERVKEFIASAEADAELEEGDVDNELDEGKKVEAEHGGSEKDREKIAKDHLKEDPEYYSKLKKAGIEKEWTEILATVKKDPKGGYNTEHCSGKDKGKKIAHHETKKEALAQHRAIEANKSMEKLKTYIVWPHLGMRVELKTLKDYLNA